MSSKELAMTTPLFKSSEHSLCSFFPSSPGDEETKEPLHRALGLKGCYLREETRARGCTPAQAVPGRGRHPLPPEAACSKSWGKSQQETPADVHAAHLRGSDIGLIKDGAFASSCLSKATRI